MEKGLMRLTLTSMLIFTAFFAIPNQAVSCLYDKCFNTSYGSWYHDSITIVMEAHGYSLSMEAGDALIVRACNLDGSFNPKLELISPQGNVIVSAGIPGTGITEMISRQITADGNYSIVIRDHGGNGRGEYYLSIQSLNRPKNAELFLYDHMERDTLIKPAQLKAYEFDASAGDMVNIQMIAITDGFQPQIRLYSPAGDFVSGDADNDYAVIANKVLTRSGMHTMIADDHGGDDTGEYFLILSRAPLDVDENGAGLPSKFVLEQNHPNPFNPETTISFGLLRSSFVTVEVYNILGENIRTLVSDDFSAGRHSVVWDGRDGDGAEVSSGVYFYRLVTDEFSDSRKMVLLR